MTTTQTGAADSAKDTRAKHTPGPWKAKRIHTPPHFDRGCIAIGPNLSGMVAAVQVPELDTASEANARLIAAAPDLLAALAGVVEFATMPVDLRNKCRAAIAAAKKP